MSEPHEPKKETQPSDDDLFARQETIGPYRILSVLGQGGMGTVYRAEQIAPVKREVALKVVRFGMDSEQFLARFEVERQVLASMNHPNIAVVHDAGTTRHAMPYFVMELLDGVAINDYCDRNQLGVNERLKLFLDVCRGIQHAHQKGIIHRDIKPSNILVVEDDNGQPVPKIIDFGMAKHLDSAHEHTRAHPTEFGWTMGTPLYMCPEQMEGEITDIDTRSDVYSLGVLLYELLVGDFPHDVHSVSHARLFHMVLNEIAPTPSHRLSTLENRDEIAISRGTSVSALVRRLRGELDWVIMRAMEKDRDRRYPSVAQFSEDIERFLNHEPVSAGPPSPIYRLRKLVVRNKLATIGGLLFLLSLVAGVIGTSVGMVRAVRAKEAALASEAKAQASVAYLRKVLSSADPYRDGRKMTVEELLQNASETVQSDLSGQPEAVAAVRQTLGWTFLELGLYDKAQEELSAAYLIQEEHLGANNPITLETRNALGRLYYKLGRYAESERIHREVLAQQTAKLGERDPTVLWTMYNLAKVLDRMGQLQEAESLYRKNLRIRTEVMGEDHPSTLVSMNSLSLFLSRIGRHEEADALQRDNWKKLKAVLGADHPNTLNSASNLALILFHMKRYEEALALADDTYRHLKESLGDHPETYVAEELIGRCQQALGQMDLAIATLRETRNGREAMLDPGHPHVIRSLVYLADALSVSGDSKEAEALFETAHQRAETQLSEDHRELALTRLLFAKFLVAQGQNQDAIQLYDLLVPIGNALEAEEQAEAYQLGLDLYQQLGRNPAPLKDLFEHQETP